MLAPEGRCADASESPKRGGFWSVAAGKRRSGAAGDGGSLSGMKWDDGPAVLGGWFSAPGRFGESSCYAWVADASQGSPY